MAQQAEITTVPDLRGNYSFGTLSILTYTLSILAIYKHSHPWRFTVAINIAINGFGRIGRNVVRQALKNPNVRVVAINDLSKPETNVHLLKYDSVHGPLNAEARLEGNTLQVGSHQIRLYSEKDPSKLPWKELGVDIVMECTGVFTDREKAALHLNAGAKKVLISAPSKDADITVVYGINHDGYNPKSHHVISNASCTTNCLAPIAKVVDDAFKIQHGTMTTVHSYTNDQQVLDLAHKDLRRARAAAMNMIPTSTGAAKAIGLVLPHLKGKMDGYSVRVPTPNVSLVDMTVKVEKATTKEELNAKLKAAADGKMKGILAYVTEPLVSGDYNGDAHSSSVDAELSAVYGDGTMVKVVSWYDNETGFSARMLDIANHMATVGLS